MCFIIHPKHPTAKIAKKDIICYKLMITTLGLESLHRGYPYTLNKTNDKIVLKIKRNFYRTYFGNEKSSIDCGYHSYSSLRLAKKYKNRFGEILRNIIITYICIIPKGEQYYFNPERHEYVSTNIIIKEEL